jgi:competence protein ComEC
MRLVIPLILGILLSQYLTIPPFWLSLFFLISFLVLVVLRFSFLSYSRRWIHGSVINILFLVFGYLLSYLHLDINNQDHFQNKISQQNYLIGKVASHPTQQKDKIKVIIHSELIASEKHDFNHCEGKIIVYLFQKATKQSLNHGDQILIKGEIQPISIPKNPSAFNHKQYLHYQNIHFQAFIYAQNWKILKTTPSFSLQEKSRHIREKFKSIFQSYISSDESRAIANALILGYKKDLTPQLKNAYVESGAIHVLAVSGLHVGILSVLVLFLLNRIPLGGKIWKVAKIGLLLIIIWAFAILTGLSPSVQRAALLFSIIYLGKAIKRDCNIYNALAIAAFGMLIYAPLTLFQISFQFSFLAVLGIVYFTPKIMRFWSPNHPILFYIWQLSVVSFSAQLALVPLSLYYFHQFPIYFLLSGLFVVPIAAIVLYNGFALLISSFFSKTLASLFGSIISYSLSFQNKLLFFIQDLPFHILQGIWLSPIEVFLFYIIILGIILITLTANLKWLRLILSSLLFISCIKVNTTYQQIHQKEIVIYSIPRNSLIDFVDGKTVYSLKNQQISLDVLKYNAQNNRYSVGVEKLINLTAAHIQEGNLYKNKNHLQFYDKKLVLIHQELPQRQKTNYRFHCDYLVLQNNVDVDIKALQEYYSFSEIIADASNSNKKIKQWKAACQTQQIPFKDVKNEAAYIIKL